jgi:hypothetical protein
VSFCATGVAASEPKPSRAKRREEEHGKSRGREGELGPMYVVHCCRDLLLLLLLLRL